MHCELLPYQPDGVAVLEALHGCRRPVLFDSGRDFRGHALDIVSAEPAETLQGGVDDFTRKDLVARVNDTLTRHRLTGQEPGPGPGWLGCLGYDSARAFVQGVHWQKRPASTPQVALGFYPAVIITNHQMQASHLLWLPGYDSYADRLRNAVCAPSLQPRPAPFSLLAPFQTCTTRTGYRDAFAAVQEHILAGDCYQINLTQRFSAPCKGSALSAYRRLRRHFQSPMGGYLDIGTRQLISLSPERFVRGIGRHWTTSPIKGTAPRGKSAAEDAQLAADLAASSKNRAENVMIVDLLRNDLGQFAVPGSVRVPELWAVESYANVHHLVSTVTAERRADTSQFDAFLDCFPGGSITGAPKIRAMDIIDGLEPDYRDWYCGSLVMLSCSDYLDSSILIRSFVIEDSNINCWAGGGIVADSTCDAEYEETMTKVGAFLRCLETEA